ncbi:MAG: hypothetical protein NC097_04455 [Clostridium sp.]|nr:hypothetical protein [Prevotella sp.]MCM1429029.1 hypothetical protein [Clostridium sp.]
MKYIYSIIFISLLLASCSSDSSEELSFGPRTASVTLTTRSYDNNASDNELIHDWWMAFVNSSGKVVKIVERNSDVSEGVSNESFEVTIDAGTYTIYAFANMGTADPNTERFGFKEGSQMPSGIEDMTWSAVPSDDAWVPMTGKLTVDIRQQASTHFVVEVVRLVAKMQLEITNDTDNGITLNELSLLPAKTDKVNLLPDYTSLAGSPKMNPLASCTQLDRTYRLPIARGNTLTDTFYLLESTAENHQTGYYVVKMNITHDSGRREVLSALTSELQWINRNDYIILPLKIINFSLSFDILFYPPIGGYPAILVERKGDEYYANFGSSGRFVINAMVRDSKGSVLSADEYTIATLSVNDPDKIFSKNPAIAPITGEIIGELTSGSKTGTATLDFDITVTYKDSADSTPISYTFSRTLYVTRQ